VKKPTLHEEIAGILKENCNNWMTAHEIAEQVNDRNIYLRQNNQTLTEFPMSSNQISARINKYLEIFEKDKNQHPQRVRLR